jgi:hypothetical protein
MKPEHEFLYGVMIIIGIVCFADVLYITTQNGFDATKSRDEVTYSQSHIAEFVPGIYALNQSFMDNLEFNRSIHIPENSTENWTIWKGDKMICYISRGDMTEYFALTGLGNGTSHN